MIASLRDGGGFAVWGVGGGVLIGAGVDKSKAPRGALCFWVGVDGVCSNLISLSPCLSATRI
ncbi:hypothetical protein [Rappaport israeli]|uniref:hypothetical protein n=1 Tax=Rappaport israeli TaxID=1839807 RepID=UPI000931BAD4|nr:hypothetical protein [Rappaport israeli]